MRLTHDHAAEDASHRPRVRVVAAVVFSAAVVCLAYGGAMGDVRFVAGGASLLAAAYVVLPLRGGTRRPVCGGCGTRMVQQTRPATHPDLARADETFELEDGSLAKVEGELYFCLKCGRYCQASTPLWIVRTAAPNAPSLRRPTTLAGLVLGSPAPVEMTDGEPGALPRRSDADGAAQDERAAQSPAASLEPAGDRELDDESEAGPEEPRGEPPADERPVASDAEPERESERESERDDNEGPDKGPDKGPDEGPDEPAAGVSSLRVPVPDDVMTALELDAERMPANLLMAAAVKLYEMRKLSAGAAAQLAGVNRPAFEEKLGAYNVAVYRLTTDDLEGEFEHA